MPRAAALLVLLVAAVPPAVASLPTKTTPRPGPELLYARPSVAPQLTNRRPFRARPILVSGATAYRAGEFLYQDFLYDDSGAQGAADPDDPRASSNTFSKQNGTYTYPRAAAYANNAADIVELRVRPVRRATAFRLTLNTMKDPLLVAFTIALGGRPGQLRELPFGANVRAPADRFLTVHPDGERMVGVLTDAATGRSLPRGTVRASVDRTRRQITVRVPNAAWNPGRRTVRLAAGAGLWDAAAGAYLLPGRTASETRPGGAPATGEPAAFFNVAFRSREPFQELTTQSSVLTDAAWWRDREQGEALKNGDLSPFFARVSFGKLHRRVRDERGVPRTGTINRILSSRFEVGEGGVDFTQSCITQQATCKGTYQGRLQPYALYVPAKARPQRGWGMTLLMHSLGANYNQYSTSRNQRQFGDRGAGSLVLTPEARGPDLFYENYGAADVFEAWADVARRYRLDPSRAVATGYSMGGIGSFKLAAQFPDLFARIQPTVGYEGRTAVLASLRNVPVHMWNNRGDELVNDVWFTTTADALDALGYRYRLDAFQPCLNPGCSPLFPNHLQLAVNDQYAPMAEFLVDDRVNRNPARVTYVVDPSRSRPELSLVGDHAYWVSGLKLRAGAATGQIDARSRAFGLGDPPVSPTERGTGTLEGGKLGNLLFERRGRTWGDAPAAPAADRVDIRATGLTEATINVRRARLSCAADVRIESDGPLTVTLAGCDRTVRSP